MRPKDALTLKQILRLERTIVQTRKSWLHLCHNGQIAVVNQRNGDNAIGQVRLTRAEFEKFARFYTAAQRTR